MGTSTVIVIDAQGGAAWENRAGGPARTACFGDGHESAAAGFREWLRARPRGGRYTVLLDLAEERFVVERVPRAGPSDSRKMIERKLAQHFPDTPFTLHLPLPDQGDRGPLRRLLLGAITRPALLEPWLAALAEAGAQLARVVSTPLLLDAWNRLHFRRKGDFLLLSSSASTLRVTFFQGGRVRFSRVVPPRGQDREQSTATCRAELEQTRAYVSTQLLGKTAPALPTLVLARPADQAFFRELLEAGENGETEFIDLSSPRAEGAHTELAADSCVTPLLVRQAAHWRPLPHYTPPGLRRSYVAARAGTGLLLAASAAAAACLFLAGRNMHEVDRIKPEVAALAHERRTLQQEADTLAHAPPGLPAPATDTLAWIEAIDRQLDRAIPPLALLRRISAVLEAIPELRLERLQWRIAEPSSDEPVLAPGAASPDRIVVDLVGSLPRPTAPEITSHHPGTALADRLRARLGVAVEVRRPDPSRNLDDPLATYPNPGATTEVALRLILPRDAGL